MCWASLSSSASSTERSQLHSQISPSRHVGGHHSAGTPFQLLELGPHQEPILELCTCLLSPWGSAPWPSLPQACDTPGFESCTVLDPMNKLMSLSLYTRHGSQPVLPSARPSLQWLAGTDVCLSCLCGSWALEPLLCFFPKGEHFFPCPHCSCSQSFVPSLPVHPDGVEIV